jgi:hypothetical protein
MLHFPKFRKINNAAELEVFATTYTQCSGFNVPRDYYLSNQVFGVFWRSNMVGGFVLGTGERLRTLEVFAGTENRVALYKHVQQAAPHTEMCCFWMNPVFHKKTWLNFFVWLCVAYALQVYGTQRLIFGTNSARLAALYGATPKCHLLHTDYIHHKRTFIFTGPRKHCLLGVAQILLYKIKRLGKMTERKNKPRVAFASVRM